jgi:ParB family chromosome partitioning protein
MSLRDDLKAKSQRALATMGATKQGETRDTRPVTTPGAVAFMQPTIDALNERVKRAEALNAELEQQLSTQTPRELPIEMLDEVPGRRRRLTPDQFEELKENLRNNPLVHPIGVKACANGRYEIVSGYNRVDAFRALGRATVPVNVLDIEADVTDTAAFYANLLQPSLPDYEKYLGFKRQKDKTKTSQKELAKAAGIAESTVSMLFAFEGLPARAKELIEDRPEGIGMSCASELARVARDGAADRVVEAVELVLAGKLSQKEAVEYAARKAPRLQAPRQASTAPVKVRAGRLEFCQYVARGASLRIDFKLEEHRAEAEARIATLLQELAHNAK